MSSNKQLREQNMQLLREQNAELLREVERLRLEKRVLEYQQDSGANQWQSPCEWVATSPGGIEEASKSEKEKEEKNCQKLFTPGGTRVPDGPPPPEVFQIPEFPTLEPPPPPWPMEESRRSRWSLARTWNWSPQEVWGAAEVRGDRASRGQVCHHDGEVRGDRALQEEAKVRAGGVRGDRALHGEVCHRAGEVRGDRALHEEERWRAGEVRGDRA